MFVGESVKKKYPSSNKDLFENTLILYLESQLSIGIWMIFCEHGMRILFCAEKFEIFKYRKTNIAIYFRFLENKFK